MQLSCALCIEAQTSLNVWFACYHNYLILRRTAAELQGAGRHGTDQNPPAIYRSIPQNRLIKYHTHPSHCVNALHTPQLHSCSNINSNIASLVGLRMRRTIMCLLANTRLFGQAQILDDCFLTVLAAHGGVAVGKQACSSLTNI